jgi:hypothetical protein
MEMTEDQGTEVVNYLERIAVALEGLGPTIFESVQEIASELSSIESHLEAILARLDVEPDA